MLRLGVGQSAQGNGREAMTVPEFPCPGSKYTFTSYQKKGVLNHSFSLTQGGMALSVLLPQAPECRVTWVSDQPLCVMCCKVLGLFSQGLPLRPAHRERQRWGCPGLPGTTSLLGALPGLTATWQFSRTQRESA